MCRAVIYRYRIMPLPAARAMPAAMRTAMSRHPRYTAQESLSFMFSPFLASHQKTAAIGDLSYLCPGSVWAVSYTHLTLPTKRIV